MSKSVNLYLALGVAKGIGFWDVNFTEDDDIITKKNSKLLECYRKELFGLEAAMEVKEAITSTLDLLVLSSENDGYKINNSLEGYSPEIPLKIIEEIFDIWAYSYQNQYLWKKYIGLLKLRKKLIHENKYIYKGLKGKLYKFAIKLDDLVSFRPDDFSVKINRINKPMW